MFDTLVKSMIMYGAEIWGFKEYEKLERLQRKYMKWTLILEGNTPNYLLMEEKRRDEIVIEAGARAIEFGEKIGKWRKNR